MQRPAQTPAIVPPIASAQLTDTHVSREQLFSLLQTSEAGLTDREAQQRLKKFGPNEPASLKQTSALLQFLRLFLNPLVIILLLASLVSAFLGDVVNAGIIIVMVVLGLSLNFMQSYRSLQAVERLRAKVAPMATVLRDGKWQALPRRAVVPGDCIRLAAGDLVPADAALLQAVDLHVQQAALTGESMPAEKRADDDDEQVGDEQGAEAANRVFLGTSVVSGSATALVTATGRNTAFGDIVVRLAHRPPETEFERGIRRFSFLILETVIFLILFVFLTGVVFHHPLFESMLFAIALAVGLTPEFLPMITTVTLGQGATRMAKKKVIVKHLESMQNFGSIDVLCSDKTGTITKGIMSLNSSLDLNGNTSERVLLLATLNSQYETGIRSPLDAAILAHTTFDLHDYTKLDEIPFDFERRRLSIVVERNGEPVFITKGAPESVISVCTTYEVDGEQHALDISANERCKAEYERLSAEGFRVLAVAYRVFPGQQREYHREDEQNLVLVGFLTFSDPAKPDVADSLQALRKDGVHVKILTGDNELVTRHVCTQVGLAAERIILGSELEHMSDAALAHVVEQTDIFARVSPAQKNRIILALKSRHHVVGFLGDGINDAPSLHTADVGISVDTAADVAKDAASIILLEQSLGVLHDGIIEGRKAFGNVIKYLLMGTSSNFGNMFSMAGAFVFLPFLPMLPTQILLNNFMYDLAQITIPTDTVDASFILKPQRWNISLIRNFMLFIGPISSIFDFLTFFIMLTVFQASQTLFHTGWFVESLATQTLVLFIIRTASNPFKSRPSRPVTITVLLIVALGVIIPYTPLGTLLGFVPLPGLYFLFLGGMTVIYLFLVELVKRRLMRRLLQ
ncbi:MAG TPA: magnesium-translocating P-type ATPase [Ktedonobacteraceae bacterium]|jgi:Mg2+-importing ATPase|nr:magnesium-translocating P-type ATPase [Ktedonobacteraceae bacterium]